MLVQHMVVTIFMSFVLVVVMGVTLEGHSRRAFLQARGLHCVRWQPFSVLAPLAAKLAAALAPLVPQRLGPALHRLTAYAWGVNTPLAARQAAGCGEGKGSCASAPCEAAAGACCGPSSSQAGEGADAPTLGGGCLSAAQHASVQGGCCESQEPSAREGQAGQGGVDKAGLCYATDERQLEACQRLLEHKNRLDQERKRLAFRRVPSACRQFIVRCPA